MPTARELGEDLGPHLLVGFVVEVEVLERVGEPADGSSSYLYGEVR